MDIRLHRRTQKTTTIDFNLISGFLDVFNLNENNQNDEY
jgi:hypothetical protein